MRTEQSAWLACQPVEVRLKLERIERDELDVERCKCATRQSMDDC